MFGHVVNVLGPVWSSRIISLTTIFVEIMVDMFAFGRKVGHSAVHWLGGSSSVWVFMRENIGPYPSWAVNNYQSNDNVTWHFDLAESTLKYVDPNFESECNIIIEPRQLPWLSAKIVYDGGEVEIDDFGAEFNFTVPRGVKPTPKLILNCWSIWSGIWLMPGQDARFVIINDEGEEETFFIHTRPSSEVDRWSELFEIDEGGSKGHDSEEHGADGDEHTNEEHTVENGADNNEGEDDDADDNDADDNDDSAEGDEGEDADAEMSEESAEVVDKAT